MGLTFCVVCWLVLLSFSLFYLMTSVPTQKVIIMTVLISVGLMASMILFVKNKNLSAVITMNAVFLVGLLYASRFPVVGPSINLFLCCIGVYPVILLERRNLAVMLFNLIGCVLTLTWTELYQNIATAADVTEQIFIFLVKFTLIVFGFGQAYAIRVLFERNPESTII